jgi:hypothetical protein
MTHDEIVRRLLTTFARRDLANTGELLLCISEVADLISEVRTDDADINAEPIMQSVDDQWKFAIRQHASEEVATRIIAMMTPPK